jgi:hypothetical protein
MSGGDRPVEAGALRFKATDEAVEAAHAGSLKSCHRTGYRCASGTIVDLDPDFRR